MDQMSKYYDVISVAYRSRLLFRTEAEYRNAWGASFETVMSKRDSERDMEVYYSILAREAAKASDLSLKEIIRAYVVASDVYQSLDWGDRTQMASRKKFCRMLFRLAITAGRALSADEIFKFKHKEADRELLEVFFPDGVDDADAPVVAIGFIVLFAFGIVRPWNGDNSRGRDIRDSETIGSLKKLGDLIRTLKEDTPRLGSTEKPLAFDECSEIIEQHLHKPEELPECTPMESLVMITEIMLAGRSLVISDLQRIRNDKFHGLYMHGIWIDDADKGQTRFWIFPDNCLAAMCYKHNGFEWELDMYDFRVREAFNSDYMDEFILLTPQGNLNYTLSPDRVITDEQMATGCYEDECDETTGEISRLTLYDEPRRFPAWLNWRTWEQLSRDDSRHKEFRSVLADIYNPQSPLSMLFRNSARELTDSVNNLVGRDNMYLYVYDWRPKYFRITEESPDVFFYEGCGSNFIATSLFELNISEKHPLYAIPVKPERKQYGDAELNRLAEILTDADNIREASIIHSDDTPYPRLLFPTYGLTVSLNMEKLKELGVVRFTSRPD
ncbi:MAG: hypothetical protein K2N10_03535 [Muribaculaceae bacterium]|nr:hypothetical protein [Muribaculaceae bacterium]